MRTFTGSWNNRLGAGVTLSMGCSTIYFSVLFLLRTHDQITYPGSGFLFILGGGFAIWSMSRLLRSFTSYQVDPAEGITRRAWNGPMQMLWSDITSFETIGQGDGTLTFLDQTGRNLTVDFAEMEGKQCEDLHQLLAPHLEALRKRKQREVSLPGKVYYPTRRSAWAWVATVILVVMSNIVCLSMPVPADQRGYFYGIMGTLIVVGLIFCVFSIATYTNSLMFTEQAIRYRLWMRSNTLPFHKVTSVVSRMQQFKGDTWESTTIEGDGQKVVISSKMPDYPVIVDFVRAHVDQSAQRIAGRSE